MILYQATGRAHGWSSESNSYKVSALGPTPRAACKQAENVAFEAFPDASAFRLLGVKEVVIPGGHYDRGTSD